VSAILVVGSVALDSVETPFGKVDEALGGSATFFSAAASVFADVQLVGVVGDDFPLERLDFLRRRGVDFSGLEVAKGHSFRWSGVYEYDLNTRHTLSTELGVFADFRPIVPDQFRSAEWVFLGNIDPVLQHAVLDQVDSPRFVACDTMDFWIEGAREPLDKLLPRIDMLVVNDAEIRELAGEHNLLRAARWVQDRGPRHVIVKKGEHGAVLFTGTSVFFAPGYPLEEIFDPTGAGDAFAGGLVGYLAYVNQASEEELRRAVVFGSALGSFACESFGPDRLAEVGEGEVFERVALFREMTRFEELAAEAQ
jgi:sugar/nucleoside kinase (ribokinase family)